MAKISIIGAGTWGIGLTVLLSNNGHQVNIWSAVPAEVEMLQKNREHKKANAMPVHIHFLARCGFCAPIFWADMDAIALENAPAGSIAKLSNFAQIPTAAEATTPRELTIALITRNDRLTMVS